MTGRSATADIGQASTPLNVLIVGAGIGGLTAAIALRQQGHHVTIFERSRFANELGAALHLPPNANGILRRFGLNAEDIGAVEALWFKQYSASGELHRVVDTQASSGLWQQKWLLVHRVHLHNELKRRATATEGLGRPAELLTSSTIVDVSCETATLTLESGKKLSGDLVLVADGVHSKLRNKIIGQEVTPFPSGKSAYRFLIPKRVALEDPVTAKLVEKDGGLIQWIGTDRRIVMYGCHYNELLNFVCPHPDTSTGVDHNGWGGNASKEDLLETYKSFDPAALALLEKVDQQALKLWTLLDLEQLPTWTNGRVALLGDAAHPFLPYQAQGGAQAIEDAASVAVVLPLGTKQEEVHDRLKLYEKCRHGRASTVQEYTRKTGSDEEKDGRDFDVMKYTDYNYGHDEWHYSTSMLRKWELARNPNVYRRMPLSFGPFPGPQQSATGQPRNRNESTFVTALIKFKTSRTMLQTLFPTNAFSFQSPATVAYATLSITTLDRMEWLGGRGYNHFGLFVHGVQCKGADGSLYKGTYLPILFENETDPIVSGREELGWPKLYSDLDISRSDTTFSLDASWRGVNFAKFTLDGLTSVDPSTAAPSPSTGVDNGTLCYRYVPAVGEPGKADVEYPVFVPSKSTTKEKVLRKYRAEKASFAFEPKDWSALPTLHHVVAGLAEVPVYEILGGEIIEGTGVSDVTGIRKI